MDIRLMTVEQVPQAVTLAVSVYELAIKRNVPQEMTYYFYEYVRAESLERKVESGELLLFGAYEGEILMGVLGLQISGLVTMLYVDYPYLRKGVARTLVSRANQYAREKLNLTGITANVFPNYNVELFKKMNFRVSPNFQPQTMAYVPMRRECAVGELQIVKRKFNWKVALLSLLALLLFIVGSTILFTLWYYS